ncbi:porin [Aequorivita marina]|uniref:porin n=1 Tax=Aequorivita marina TaxID=3073654 RepID=UPI00287707ED|nr:porin [Aequorivita sp. S2608]MDS1299528.1 porin [Aequorivita sp. S2608]
MKRLILSLTLLVGGSLCSQTVTDSVSVAQLKREIKQELRAELKADSNLQKRPVFSFKNFTLKGFGAVNYYHYNFDTDPSLKDKIDAERLNLYLGYSFSDKISLKTEIEFEHGGTGASIGYDTQEEFGEFEQEIEKGGSVKLEQIYIDFKIAPYFNVRAGRMKVHFGLSQTLDEPTAYFTSYRPEMENEILPLGWYENGVQFYGRFAKRFSYEASIVSGLDASGFSSRGWIKNGYQQRFEMSTAESFAFAGRLDYHFGTHDDTFVGVSGYINDASANRPKNDMENSAYVTLVEGHVSYNEKNLRFNAVALYGNLENSNIVSKKNANLSNNLGVKRTPVGKNAFGFSAEVGYNILPLLVSNSNQMLYPFLRYDYYDTMQDVEGAIIKNPRWQRSAITGGVNWFVHPQIVVKAHYSDRRLGSENYNPTTLKFTGKKQHEKTFSAGIGFKF